MLQAQSLLASRFQLGWLYQQLFIVKDSFALQLEAACLWTDAMQVREGGRRGQGGAVRRHRGGGLHRGKAWEGVGRVGAGGGEGGRGGWRGGKGGSAAQKDAPGDFVRQVGGQGLGERRTKVVQPRKTLRQKEAQFCPRRFCCTNSREEGRGTALNHMYGYTAVYENVLS